jgi:hypothetical protein
MNQTLLRGHSWDGYTFYTGGLTAVSYSRRDQLIEQTRLFLEDVLDRTLADVVTLWEYSLNADPNEAADSFLFPVAEAAVVERTAESGVVGAVRYVAETLGVPHGDVLAAAGIKPRTYHEWKSKGREPRLGSQGELWKLVGIVEDLAAGETDVAVWFKSDTRHRDLLRAGDLDRLAASPDGRGDLLAPMAASAGQAGSEVVLPRMAPPKPAARTKIKTRGHSRTGFVGDDLADVP